jgi:hypothetical protein
MTYDVGNARPGLGLPLLQFFHVEDLSREVVVSSVMNTLSENIKLVRKILQALCPPFQSSTLTPKQSKK